MICPKLMVMAAAEVKPLMTGQEMKSSRNPDQPGQNSALVPEDTVDMGWGRWGGWDRG